MRVSAELRFEILCVLGEGGMSVVYDTRDRVRDMTVALRQLRSRDANLLYHFKHEFRALADLHHQNLCTLFELFEAEGKWFFTMELVEGCDLEAWIRPPQRLSTPYVPEGVWARPGLEAADRSLLLRIQIARAIADWRLGWIAACGGDVAEVIRRSHALVEQGVSYAAVWSGLLLAAAVYQRGDRSGTVMRLDAVAAFADDHDLPLCAAVARLRAGQIIGGSEGAARVAQASAWMTGQDIRDPIKMCDVFAPGFGHRDDNAVARPHA